MTFLNTLKGNNSVTELRLRTILISLDNVNINDEGAQVVSEILEQNKELNKLCLSIFLTKIGNNKITNKGGNDIGIILQKGTNLTSLNLCKKSI